MIDWAFNEARANAEVEAVCWAGLALESRFRALEDACCREVVRRTTSVDRVLQLARLAVL